MLLKCKKRTIDSITRIVETWSSGASWYRVYSDGWCEQGGIHSLSTSAVSSVSFVKSYLDTNYYLNISDGVVSSSWSGAEANDYMPSISTDGFTFKSAYDRTCDFIWVSSGYIF